MPARQTPLPQPNTAELVERVTRAKEFNVGDTVCIKGDHFDEVGPVKIVKIEFLQRDDGSVEREDALIGLKGSRPRQVLPSNHVYAH